MQNLYKTFFEFGTFVKGVSLFFIVIISSCKVETKGSGYFDLSNFVKNEAIRYCEKNQEVVKVVYLNGMTEKKNICIYDWDVELSSFIETDLNKAFLRGKYKVDTTQVGLYRSVHYVAMDSVLTIREVRILFDTKGVPIEMNGTRATKNVLYASKENLRITFGKEYWVTGKMKVGFLEPDTFSVQAIFTP